MATITVDSHDVLGSLSIIKNYLAVVQSALAEGKIPEAGYVDRAMSANEALIVQIKEKTLALKQS